MAYEYYNPNSGNAPNPGAAPTPGYTQDPSYNPAPNYAPNPGYNQAPAYNPAPNFAPNPGYASRGVAQMNATPTAPVAPLRTNRALWKMIVFSAITFGIYGLVVMCHISRDINTIATRYDGKRTMHYALVTFVFSWLTFGIVPLVWSHKISGRIGRELARRNIRYGFGAHTFWLWNILGSMIFVGPFIYTHKLMVAMNLLAKDYNVRG